MDLLEFLTFIDIEIETDNFDWVLHNIRIQKIILATTWVLSPNLGHKVFLEISALLNVRRCPKLQSCAISRKTNYVNLGKWQEILISGHFRVLKIFRKCTSIS